MGNTLSAQEMGNVGIRRVVKVRDREQLQLAMDKIHFHRINNNMLNNTTVWKRRYARNLPAYINKEGYGACLIRSARESKDQFGNVTTHYAVRVVDPLEGTRYERNTVKFYIDVPKSIDVNGRTAILVLHLKMVIVKFIHNKANPDDSLVYLCTYQDYKNVGSPEMTFKEFMRLVDSDKDSSLGYKYAWQAFMNDNMDAVISLNLDQRYTPTAEAQRVMEIKKHTTSQPSFVGAQQKKIGAMPASLDVESSRTQDAYEYCLRPNWMSIPTGVMKKYDEGDGYMQGSSMNTYMSPDEERESSMLAKRQKIYKFLGIGGDIHSHKTASHANLSLLKMLS